MTHTKTASVQDLPDLGNGRNLPPDETQSAGGEGRERVWGKRTSGCGRLEPPAFIWRTVIKLDLRGNETLLKVGRMTGWKVRSEDQQIKGGGRI